ncbi:MAG TPA: HigA family addiction module antitoxin, partial [Longimicrobiales bacterium]|nr:HigA family addiction module antitoxin [Longimicrobiales bacterium]
GGAPAPAPPPTPAERIGGALSRCLRPEHPGVVFGVEFLEPAGIAQRVAARVMGMSGPRLNEIVNGKRTVTPDTAMRFARFTGTFPEFWLEFQWHRDLWDALRAPAAREVARIRRGVME